MSGHADARDLSRRRRDRPITPVFALSYTRGTNTGRLAS
jgi:hypothetical protein